MIERRQDKIIGPGLDHAAGFAGRRPWSAEILRVQRPETKIPVLITIRPKTLVPLPIHIITSQPDRRAGGMPPFTKNTNTSATDANDQRIHPRIVERSRPP